MECFRYLGAFAVDALLLYNDSNQGTERKETDDGGTETLCVGLEVGLLDYGHQGVFALLSKGLAIALRRSCIVYLLAKVWTECDCETIIWDVVVDARWEDLQ